MPSRSRGAMKFLKPVFGDVALSEITAEAIEDYLAVRLRSGRRVRTKKGLEFRGRIKPATVHQEFRILSHMLNVAVKQKRLSETQVDRSSFRSRLRNRPGSRTT